MLLPLTLALLACARPPRASIKARPLSETAEPAQPPAPRGAVTPDTRPADGPRGWYVVAHCIRGFKTVAIKGLRGVHFEEDFYTSYADGYVVRRKATLMDSQVEGSGAWTTFYATVEVGRARWMVDGYVPVDTPGWSPSERQMLLSRADELKMMRMQLWIHKTEGMLLETSLDTRGGHAEQCTLVPADERASAAFDVAVGAAVDPARCARATACCRALEKHDSSDAARDVCSNHPDLDPQFCGSWLARVLKEPRSPLPPACIDETTQSGAR